MLLDPDADSRARYSLLPAVFQAAACSQWIGYATFVLPSLPLVINNIIGISVAFCYIVSFVIARPKWPSKVFAALLFVGVTGFSVLVYGVLYFAGAYPSRDVWALSITTAVTIVLWASPLAALYAAARELDTKRVPVPLTLVMLSTTLLWLIVGFLVGDMALIVCSAFGVSLSFLQVVVMIWIRFQTPKSIDAVTIRTEK